MSTVGEKRIIRILNDVLNAVTQGRLRSAELHLDAHQKDYPEAQTLYDLSLTLTLNDNSEYAI